MGGARAIAFAVVVFVFGSLASGIATAQNLGPLNGTWEGDLQSVVLKGEEKPTTSWRRIVISDRGAQVFYKSDGKIIEVKPGKFLVERHRTNAVVIAIDSGKDNEGTWVETWAFAVTQKDQNTLMTNFMRQVNNINLPLSVEHSKFSAAAIGELTRR